MSRRTLFKWLISGGSALMVSIVAIPALIAALAPVSRTRRQDWRPVGSMKNFPSGEVVKATIAPAADDLPVDTLPARAVYVWRQTPAQTIVFSPACTDLGCPVNYDSGSEFFYCPCHGGIFNKRGEPVAGPPKRQLFRYATRVRGEVLEIDLASVPPLA